MSPKYHQIKVVIEVTSLERINVEGCAVSPTLRSEVASISGTGLEMTSAQALQAIYLLQEALRGDVEQQVEVVAEQFGLGGDR